VGTLSGQSRRDGDFRRFFSTLRRIILENELIKRKAEL
jgi:hypothetical protein